MYILSIMTRSGVISLIKAEGLLLAHEDMYERFRKSQLGPLVKANFTNPTQIGRENFHGTSQSRRDRGSRIFRGGRNLNQDSRPQCQVCGKHGHIALSCFHIFDQAFQANSGPVIISQSSSILPPPSTFHNPRAYLATPVLDFTWLPDIGASHHVTADS
ncbi:hypothetical protein AHAS_AhasUnG0033800 [Arachis hypogaea]